MTALHEKHQNSSRVPHGSVVRVLSFKSHEDKSRWLDAAAGLDSLRGGVQRVSRRFIHYRDPESRTRAIHRWVRDAIKYEHDFRTSTGERGEEFADTETAIQRGYEDCDGKARVMVALVRAAEMIRPMGVQARIRPVFLRHPLAFVHVQVEVRWPGSELFEESQEGGWILAEVILKGCELGQDPDTCPRGPRGERLIA
jgi:hypothetical protein